MKYVILLPIYNDRESLKLLIDNINNEVKDLNHEVSVLVINDASSQQIVDNNPKVGTVIGKAVGSKTDSDRGVVEIVVGKH